MPPAQAAFELLGQAEVGDFGRVGAAEQNVGRLEIAVQNAVLMGELDPPG